MKDICEETMKNEDTSTIGMHSMSFILTFFPEW